ncbi:hypothetical protein CW304_16495 [Bacillus sp. UFRGS-B20]|nr:hypothetical protein CW304_16495 [Bacillus sp. UFRGS-B20]
MAAYIYQFNSSIFFVPHKPSVIYIRTTQNSPFVDKFSISPHKKGNHNIRVIAFYLKTKVAPLLFHVQSAPRPFCLGPSGTRR